MVEERKIVKSGNSSFIVTLPIKWVNKNKLEKGSHVQISENEVGDLVISGAQRRNKENPEVKSIQVDGKTLEMLSFEICNSYIQQYQDMLLEGKEVSRALPKIKSILKNCIGLEIIEQDKKNVIVKNFTTNDNGLSPRALIRKMTLGIGEIFILISRFIKEGFSQSDINELQELIEQNNRLYLLTRKAILRAIESPEHIRIFQTTYHQLTKDKVIAISFHQMMFALSSLGNVMLFIEHTKEDAAKLKELLDAIKADYESLLSNLRYKNANSLASLHERCLKNSAKVKALGRETKNYFIIESSIYLSIVLELMRHMIFELSE